MSESYDITIVADAIHDGLAAYLRDADLRLASYEVLTRWSAAEISGPTIRIAMDQAEIVHDECGLPAWAEWEVSITMMADVDDEVRETWREDRVAMSHALRDTMAVRDALAGAGVRYYDFSAETESGTDSSRMVSTFRALIGADMTGD